MKILYGCIRVENLHACLDKIEKSISKNSTIRWLRWSWKADAQMAAGARIYPPFYEAILRLSNI